MKTLLILNDALYGSECTYNGARLAGVLARHDGHEVRVFLMGDAAAAAHANQKVPPGFYNLELMLRAVLHRDGRVGICGTCLDARGSPPDALRRGARRSTLDELAQWTAWADKVLVFCQGGRHVLPATRRAKAPRFPVSSVAFDVVHTEDSVCLLVRDLRRGDEPWFVITGDTLFVGAVGRPDLAGHEREMAARLHDSLDGKLLDLPDDMEIFPGHQAGSACGAGLSGKQSSTIGFEKRWNEVLRMDKAAFVEQLTQGIPLPPADMDAIVRANLGL